MRLVYAVGVLILTAALFADYGGLSAGTVPEQEERIAMGDFWFKPSTVTVSAGPLKFVLKNNGVVGHTYVIEKVKGAALDLIDPGKTGMLKITLKSGTYAAFCDVPGHREAGMEMKITVK